MLKIDRLLPQKQFIKAYQLKNIMFVGWLTEELRPFTKD
jgi:hypothetical protein